MRLSRQKHSPRLATICASSPLFAIFLLFGCGGNDPQDHAECTQGATRELACGELGAGKQTQRCSERFRWADEGSCVIALECEMREERTELCGGFNGRASRSQRCDYGRWPEAWSTCVDPDECANDSTKPEACTGDEAGVHGRAMRERVCVDGRWAGDAACIDPDRCSPDAPSDTCDDEAQCVLVGDGYACVCNSGYEVDGASCEDIDECSVLGEDACDPRASCENTLGDYVCHCPDGLLPSEDDPRACVGFVDVAANAKHSCAISEVGELFCWGANDYGQVGFLPTTPTFNGVYAPHKVARAAGASQSPWKKVTAGKRHTCAITEDGELFCWGSNAHGQIGYYQPDGGLDPKIEPVEVSASDTPQHTWIDVAAGDRHTCALRSNQHIYCWGNNDMYQLGGIVSGVTTPLQVDFSQSPRAWQRIRAGHNHTCVSDQEDGVFCWGANTSRQIGVAPPLPNSMTLKRIGSAAWAWFEASRNTSCVVSNSGALSCVGEWVGTADLTPRAPELDVESIALGGEHRCVLTKDAELFCWGANSQGQGGIGNIASLIDDPMLVPGDATWSAVAAGDLHNCGIRGGALVCWGANGEGQVAQPSSKMRETSVTPVKF